MCCIRQLLRFIDKNQSDEPKLDTFVCITKINTAATWSINKITPVSIALEETKNLSDLEDDFLEDTFVSTLEETSNSQLIHPDVTNVTGSYTSQSKMATSFEPQYFNRKSSSMNDLQRERDFENSTLSTTNLGLTYVLNERNIQGKVINVGIVTFGNPVFQKVLQN